jgi:hypothetical protein
VGDGVVDGIDTEEEVLCGQIDVGAYGTEVFANRLLGAAEGTGDAGWLTGSWIGQFRAIGRGPELQQIGDTGREADVYK